MTEKEDLCKEIERLEKRIQELLAKYNQSDPAPSMTTSSESAELYWKMQGWKV